MMSLRTFKMILSKILSLRGSQVNYPVGSDVLLDHCLEDARLLGRSILDSDMKLVVSMKALFELGKLIRQVN